MNENRIYSVTRKYFSKLSFYDKSYHDAIQDNKWELYGAIKKPLDNDYVRTDMINNMGWSARCDIHEGRFKDYSESQFHTNCLTIINNGGYIRNKKTISLNNQDFTIACWFRLDPLYMSRYSDHDQEDVTLCGWTDASGKKISIDVFHKDYKNILGNATLRMYYDDRYTEGQYKIPGTIPQNGKWMLFSFQTYNGYNIIHIDGHKIIETRSANEFAIGTDLIDLKLGAFKSTSAGGIDIDDIIVMNDHIEYGEYEVPDRPIVDELPELYYQEDNRNTERSYHKSGKLYGLEFEHYENPSISGSTLTFSSGTSGKEIIGLFMNSTYVDPSRYTRSDNRITMKSSTGIGSAHFSLVVLKQEISNGFYIDVHQIDANETIPKIDGKMDTDSFLLFDGSLALVQQDRYTVSGERIQMTNPSDTIGGKLTLVYIRKKETGPYKDSNIEISFERSQGIVANARSVTFSKLQDYITYNKNDMLFFLNGSYLPASAFTISGETLSLNSGIEDFIVSDIVIAIFMISNQYPNIPWKVLNYLNGSSQWDKVIDNIDIVRNNNKTLDKSKHTSKIL